MALGLNFSSIYVSRTLRVQSWKLAVLRYSLLLGLVLFIVLQAFNGGLYREIRADHWILGDLQTLKRPRPSLQTDTKMKEPTCAARVTERLGPLERRHLQRVANWVDDNGVVMFTPDYVRDFCSKRILARFQYGARVVGLLFGSVPNTLAVLSRAHLNPQLYTVWPDRQAPVPNASFFEAPPKIWWGTGTKDLTNAKGFFRSGGALQLVLSTGQELEADFNGTFVKVRARDGEVVYARFEKGQLHWLEQNPFGKKAETWHLLPPLETQEMSESQLSLLQTPVVALAANTEGEALWSKNKIQKVLEELDPKENSITLVYESVGAKPCVHRPLATRSKDLGMHDVLINTLAERFVYTSPRTDTTETTDTAQIFLGGHANLDVDETVLRISISTMRHTGTLSGELLSCRMASSECENSGPANVELKNWESKAQEAILIPVAKLLDMQDLDLDTCSNSDACTLLLVVDFSNSLDWTWLRAMWSDDYGQISFKVRVYNTSMAGTISDFEDVMDSSSDCIQETRYSGIRVHVRFDGVLYRWSFFQALLQLGSFVGLISVVNAVLTECTIGSLSQYFLGDVALLYKAEAVQHTGKSEGANADHLRDHVRRRVRTQLQDSSTVLTEREVDDLLGFTKAIASDESSEESAGC